jgi:hypothetical protein
VDTGDELEIDYATGRVRNISRGTEKTYPVLAPELLAIIERGGWEENFRARLAQRSA